MHTTRRSKKRSSAPPASHESGASAVPCLQYASPRATTCEAGFITDMVVHLVVFCYFPYRPSVKVKDVWYRLRRHASWFHHRPLAAPAVEINSRIPSVIVVTGPAVPIHMRVSEKNQEHDRKFFLQVHDRTAQLKAGLGGA